MRDITYLSSGKCTCCKMLSLVKVTRPGNGSSVDIVLTLGDSRVCCGLYICLELSDSIPSAASDFRALSLSFDVSKNGTLTCTTTYMSGCSSFLGGTLSLPGRRANLTGR